MIGAADMARYQELATTSWQRSLTSGERDEMRALARKRYPTVRFTPTNVVAHIQRGRT